MRMYLSKKKKTLINNRKTYQCRRDSTCSFDSSSPRRQKGQHVHFEAAHSDAAMRLCFSRFVLGYTL